MDEPGVITERPILGFTTADMEAATAEIRTALGDALLARARGTLKPPPRYVPGPVADGHARVVLWAGDPETPAGFGDYGDGHESYLVPDVFDVPADQRDRWAAAQEAFDVMQDEISALVEARSRARRAGS